MNKWKIFPNHHTPSNKLSFVLLPKSTYFISLGFSRQIYYFIVHSLFIWDQFSEQDAHRQQDFPIKYFWGSRCQWPPRHGLRHALLCLPLLVQTHKVRSSALPSLTIFRRSLQTILRPCTSSLSSALIPSSSPSCSLLSPIHLHSPFPLILPSYAPSRQAPTSRLPTLGLLIFNDLSCKVGITFFFSSQGFFEAC